MCGMCSTCQGRQCYSSYLYALPRTTTQAMHCTWLAGVYSIQYYWLQDVFIEPTTIRGGLLVRADDGRLLATGHITTPTSEAVNSVSEDVREEPTIT